MYTFIYNGKGWFLKIGDLDTLNAYFDMVWDIRHKDLEWDLKRVAKKMHPTSDLIGMCETFANVKGTDIWTEFQALKEKQFMDMSRMVIDGETLYVNACGGYTVSLDQPVNRYDNDKLMWPVFKESDIRIQQWPGGTHFYAYIGPVQVKDGEIRKWASESDARMAAMSYVTTKVRQKEVH